MNSPRTYTMSKRADQSAATGDRIANAAARLFMESRYDDVTLVDIAKAAEVSHQTVLNHYQNKEGVVAAAAEVLTAATTTARAVPASATVEKAIRILMAEYERIGDANVQWAIDADRIPALAPYMERARDGHRAWIERAFDHSLPPGGSARNLAVSAIHAATDVYTWKLLRRDLGLSRTATERTVCHLVHGVLRQR
jgi:AcrR family transcriptional regulator